jgi:hypothetical protein
METVMQLKVKLPFLQAPTILLFETVNIENKKRRTNSIALHFRLFRPIFASRVRFTAVFIINLAQHYDDSFYYTRTDSNGWQRAIALQCLVECKNFCVKEAA